MNLRALPEEGSHGTLATYGFDSFECGVLSVARYFLSSFDAPVQQGWQMAFGIAVERWGQEIGLPAAFAILKLVRSICDVRANFIYQDPSCPLARARVSQDEVLMMRMLHHMRREETSDARNCVDALTCGLMDPHVIRAGLTVATRFGGGTHIRQKPTLTVVA
ncbi:MAG: hypothetical protein AAFR68_06115 [Pseudomonadota bacterium]